MLLGERLYELRTKNNMSQGALAEKLDVSRQTVSKWENNLSVPETEKILQLSEIFSVSTDYILKGEEREEKAEPVYVYVEKEADSSSLESKEKITRKYVGLTLAIISGLLTVIFLFLTAAGFWILAIPTALVMLVGIFIYNNLKHPWFIISWTAFLISLPLMFFFTALNPLMIFDPVIYTEGYTVHLLFAYGTWAVLIALILWSVKIKRGYIFKKNR